MDPALLRAERVKSREEHESGALRPGGRAGQEGAGSQGAAWRPRAPSRVRATSCTRACCGRAAGIACPRAPFQPSRPLGPAGPAASHLAVRPAGPGAPVGALGEGLPQEISWRGMGIVTANVSNESTCYPSFENGLTERITDIHQNTHVLSVQPEVFRGKVPTRISLLAAPRATFGSSCCPR